MNKVLSVKTDLNKYSNPEKAKLWSRFFKTGKGEYGEGDKFLGITVPDVRKVAKIYKNLKIHDIKKLIISPWHEERQCALLILLDQFKKADKCKQKEIYGLYLDHTKYINNWDLVDLSCRDIVGRYIFENPEEQPIFDKLVKSKLLWDRRIAIISTFYFINKGHPEPTLSITKKLLADRHDLIQKANGWALREVGKRINQNMLIDYLHDNYTNIPRTTLRYAIEHFPLKKRQRYLSGKF